MKTIHQRELRNRIGRVLKQVEAGENMRITVDGRPVADLVPIEGIRRRYVLRDDVIALLQRASLDKKFARDIDAITGAATEEL
ncbi:MAG: type II toxin-antitoxin system Phd/YefM family antitoxin [Candidatus Binataceae bacterium]